MKIEEQDQKVIFHFEGRLDTAACAEIEKQVSARLQEAGPAVVFDLKDTDFIASAFLRLCLAASKSRGEGFSIVNVSPPIKKVFKIAGFDRDIRIS